MKTKLKNCWPDLQDLDLRFVGQSTGPALIVLQVRRLGQRVCILDIFGKFLIVGKQSHRCPITQVMPRSLASVGVAVF